MDFYLAVFLVNMFALIVAYFSSPNTIPVKGSPPLRIFGLVAMRDIIATIASGVVIGLMSDPKYIGFAIVLQFFVGVLIHTILGVKTKPGYALGETRANAHIEKSDIS